MKLFLENLPRICAAVAAGLAVYATSQNVTGALIATVTTFVNWKPHAKAVEDAPEG